MTEKFSGEKRFSVTMCSGMGHSQLAKPSFGVLNTRFSGDRVKVTQLGTASVIPTEQDARSQRAGALKRSLESWVLGSSSCTGALGAMQLLNGLFLMEYTMRP